MSCGKISSQSGHAYLGAFLEAQESIKIQYHKYGLGTKVCLECRDLGALIRCYQTAKDLGLPCVLIEDTGNNTCFNGIPTITAVGIGPCTKDQVKFLRKLQLHK